MNKKLVFIQNAQTLTTSLKVAETFGKEHKHILVSIREILAAENSTAKFFEESTFENRGKSYPMYYINRDGFTLLAMGFTGKKALQFKLAYIDAFNKMEHKLQELLASGKNAKWLETRDHGTNTRKVETSNIKCYIDYAYRQGCRWSKNFIYGTITTWCNVGAGVAKKNGRDDATIQQLNTLDLLEGSVVQNVLINGMADGLHYTRIWAQVQQKIRQFCELTGRDCPRLEGSTNG